MKQPVDHISANWPAMRPLVKPFNDLADRVAGITGGMGGSGTQTTMISGAGIAVSVPRIDGTRAFLLKIVARKGAGNYTAMIYDGDVTGASGSIAIPGSLVAPGGFNILVVNVSELTLGGAPLQPNQWMLGVVCGEAPDANGATRPVLAVASGSGVFPVLLTYGSSPGADGTNIAAATWAYTIYAVCDTALANPLASNIQPTKPRDVGPRTRQAQSVANTSYSYGTAFYGVPPSSGSNPVLLWDAGETEPALCLTGGAACT